MHAPESLEFGHDDRERIYNYVERRGSVSIEEAQKELGIDPGGMRHHVAILRRDGFIEAVEDTLRVAFERGAEEEHHEDDLDFIIRPARQDDLTGLVGSIRNVAEERSYIVAETVADLIDHEEVLLRQNELEWRVFFVATIDSEVVGWVHLYAQQISKLRHTAELTVGVLEEYRNHGIGGHLLQRGLEWASANGYEKIYQSIPSSNEEAIDFLEDHDWETEAVRPDHYKLDGEYVDEVMMARKL